MRWTACVVGDTDEFAHRNDYLGYLEALQLVDGFVGKLLATLATLEGYGEETTILITADHGRASSFSGHGGGSPESSRVWLLATGGAVPKRGSVAVQRQTRLADLTPTVRALLGLPPDHSSRAGAPIVELLPAGAPATIQVAAISSPEASDARATTRARLAE